MTVLPLRLHVIYASSQARKPLASLIGLAIGGAGGGIAVGLWHTERGAIWMASSFCETGGRTPEVEEGETNRHNRVVRVNAFL
jgi:hypothetical protein